MVFTKDGATLKQHAFRQKGWFPASADVSTHCSLESGQPREGVRRVRGQQRVGKVLVHPGTVRHPRSGQQLPKVGRQLLCDSDRLKMLYTLAAEYDIFWPDSKVKIVSRSPAAGVWMISDHNERGVEGDIHPCSS